MAKKEPSGSGGSGGIFCGSNSISMIFFRQRIVKSRCFIFITHVEWMVTINFYCTRISWNHATVHATWRHSMKYFIKISLNRTHFVTSFKIIRRIKWIKLEKVVDQTKCWKSKWKGNGGKVGETVESFLTRNATRGRATDAGARALATGTLRPPTSGHYRTLLGLLSIDRPVLLGNQDAAQA